MCWAVTLSALALSLSFLQVAYEANRDFTLDYSCFTWGRILPAMHIKGFALCCGFRRNWSHSCFCIILNPLGYLGYADQEEAKLMIIIVGIIIAM